MARQFIFIAVAILAFAGCVATTPAVKSQITNLAVALSEDGGARVTWDENPRGTSFTYVVYRDGREVEQVASPDRSFLDKTIVSGRTYGYQVKGIDGQGRETAPLSPIVNFTYRIFLSLTQEDRINRGYANFTVESRSASLRWTDLSVTLSDETLPASPSGFAVNGTWTHTNPRDALVDLGEKLEILSTRDVRRNATLVVSLANGGQLLKMTLEGRPAINLTLRQERNATEGRVALLVQSVSFVDNGRVVQPTDASLAPRWSALDIAVAGRMLRYDPLLRDASWSHENVDDAVIRVGEHLTLRHDALMARGARVTVTDAEAGEIAATAVLR